MRNLKTFLTVLVVVLGLFIRFSFANDPADSGDKGGNGGDPMATQFVVMAQKLAQFYADNPFELELPFSAADYGKEVEILSNSLEGFDKRHLIEFTDKKIIDVNGVEKPGVFEIGKPANDTQIRINRDAWIKFNDVEKLTQINLEILGILKIENRYEIAESLVKNHVLKIMSIPLDAKEVKARPGWRIVGQNPDQFAEISPDDLLIDGGTLGIDSKMNKKIEAFLLSPFAAESAPWFESLVVAWKNHRPGYLLLNSPDGNNATITAIRAVKYSDSVGFEVYSLFFTKHRQIYTGDCVDRGEKLKAIDRLKNCYLDLSNYHSFDDLVVVEGLSEKSFSGLLGELRSSLLRFYSTDQTSLSAVLRSYFITDYSMAMPQHNAEVMSASVTAFGLEPSFSGPFDRVSFWKQTSHQNIPAKRLYEAAKILAEHDLLFLDANTKCPSFSGPKIVARTQWKSEQNKCFFHRMGIDLTDELYEAMVNYGFYFDYPTKKWVLDSGVQK